MQLTNSGVKSSFSEITTALYHSIENEVNVSIAQDHLTISWPFWLFWMLAFLAFPIGGMLANILVGPITTTVQAVLAGAITGVLLVSFTGLSFEGQYRCQSLDGVAPGIGMAIG